MNYRATLNKSVAIFKNEKALKGVKPSVQEVSSSVMNGAAAAATVRWDISYLGPWSAPLLEERCDKFCFVLRLAQQGHLTTVVRRRCKGTRTHTHVHTKTLSAEYPMRRVQGGKGEMR